MAAKIDNALQTQIPIYCVEAVGVNPTAFAHPSYRSLVPPEADYLAVGFRCVVSLKEEVIK